MSFLTKNFVIALSASLALSACVKPDLHLETQKVTIKTPGALEGKCYLENDEFKYVAYTDQTITITRTAKDLNVLCMAEGNREKSIVIKHDPSVIGLQANKVPSVITVDFTNMAPRDYDLPNYHNPDIGKYPLPVETENMGPSVTTDGDVSFNQPTYLEPRQYKNDNPFSSVRSQSRYNPYEEDK